MAPAADAMLASLGGRAALRGTPRNPDERIDAMEPATPIDVEGEALMLARPNRWVVVGLGILALVLLTLAALSSERVSAPLPRGEDGGKVIAVEAIATAGRSPATAGQNSSVIPGDR